MPDYSKLVRKMEWEGDVLHVHDVVKEISDNMEKQTEEVVLNHFDCDFSDFREYMHDKIKWERKQELAMPRWIPVTERLPECEVGAEIGNVEWIIHDMVFAGCFGRGGKYRDAYFRTWTDTTEGIDAKDADCWRVVTLPEPPKEEDHAKDGPDKAD